MEGYTLTEAEKPEVGTEITLVLKEDTETDKYSEYLDEYTISGLVKKYSDYIATPLPCTARRAARSRSRRRR